MITLAIPTLTQFDRAADCVWSALAGTRPPNRVIVIDNSGGQCPPIPGAEIIIGRQPQSVARAWNDAAALAGGDWLIISNDDLTFAPDAIAELIFIAESNPRAAIVSPIEGQRFACFLLRWAAYQAIGPFDEQFSPAYYEDNDYHRRLLLAGWDSPIALRARVDHVGSATLRAIPHEEREWRHHDLARANRKRYIKKWGSIPGDELYETPYGGRS
jgi:GT2 family glycosyltransferase